jgi:hypothetical protein
VGNVRKYGVKLFVHLGMVLILGSVLVGCASVKLPPPTASADTVEKLRQANFVPMSVGRFSLASGRDPEMDKELGEGLRGSSVSAESGSFSQHLKAELVAALKAAALYDPKSPLKVEGRLRDSMVDAAIKVGKAKLAADFIVKRGNRKIYKRALSVESEWPSSFVGAVALPKAVTEYGSLYKKLLDKLFADKKFQAAVRRR